MEIEDDASVAIVGAGPVGLEATLYLRFLGYRVELWEGEGVAANLAHCGTQAWVFGEVATPLACAALEAQDPGWRQPADDETLTTDELLARYYRPLAESDLVSDSLKSSAVVTRITRAVDEEGAPGAFEVFWRNDDGKEQATPADVVLDCSGEGAVGGLPAIETASLRLDIDAACGAPRLLAEELQRHSGERLPAGFQCLAGWLRHPETDYYVLGAKSFGRDKRFETRHGLQQIRALAARLVGREALDLYATIRPARRMH